MAEALRPVAELRTSRSARTQDQAAVHHKDLARDEAGSRREEEDSLSDVIGAAIAAHRGFAAKRAASEPALRIASLCEGWGNGISGGSEE